MTNRTLHGQKGRSYRPYPAWRQVFHADAIEWLKQNPSAPGMSVFTSLPDLSELPQLGFDGWKTWFESAAETVISWIPEQGCAIFFQSDIRVNDRWIDKAHLVMNAADRSGIPLIWHKIVCRHPPGTIIHGRAAYSHMFCFAKRPAWTPQRPGPDVIADAGAKLWERGMGVDACRVACRFLRDETETLTVVDPFCGHGTTLAAANEYGLSAVGVELSRQRCRKAMMLNQKSIKL